MKLVFFSPLSQKSETSPLSQSQKKYGDLQDQQEDRENIEMYLPAFLPGRFLKLKSFGQDVS